MSTTVSSDCESLLMPHQLPVTIPVVFKLAAGATRVNIIAGIPQRVIKEPSRLSIAMTREVALVTFGVEIGGQVAIPDGSPAQIVATIGSLPNFENDGVGNFGGDGGDEVAIFGSNPDVAIRELRAQIRITALEDVEIIQGNAPG